MSRQTDALKLMARLAKAHFSRGDKNDFKRELFNEFKKMGGVYVKFLQILATNTNFLSGWATPAESSVFEDVATENIDIYRVLYYMNKDFRKFFAAVDPKPFAAGSFAQVYRAQLTDGKNVIIKVLRPSVSRNLRQDMKNLGLIARAVSLISGDNMVDYKTAFNEFKRITNIETDYRQETKNAEWFRKYFAERNAEIGDKIFIPKTYAEFTTDRTLVQDFVGGISLADAMNMQQNGADFANYIFEKTGSNAWNQLRTIGAELIISAVHGEYIFGDPHPGNIHLLAQDKIAFIDFGIAANAPESRNAFVNWMREYNYVYAGQFRPSEFALATVAFIDNTLTQAISVSSARMTGKSVMDLIGENVKSVFETHLHDEKTQGFMNNMQMMRMMTQVINRGNRFNVKLDVANFAMLRALQMFQSTAQLIAKRAGLSQNQSNELIRYGMASAVEFADLHGVAKSKSAAETLGDERAMQIFGDWAAGIADRDPSLYRQIRGGFSL